MTLLGIATLVAVLLLGAILTWHNRRQAEALQEVHDVLESWFMVMLRDRREAKSREIQVADPLVWLAEQVRDRLNGAKVAEVRRRLTDPPAVEALLSDGRRLVVSPLDPKALKRALRPEKRGGSQAARRLAEFADDPLLPRRVEAVERSLINAGEWFDVEAARVGEALGVPWGEVERLWFYLPK